MHITLDTKTFLFDATRDYLPDYKRHMITIEDSLSVKDLLLEVQNLENFFDFDKSDTMLQINGVSIMGSLTISKAVELFGQEWTLEPISTFRAVKDLMIDDADFFEKHTILEAFGDDEDFAYYKTLIRQYYASGTLSYNQDYFGDSMFLYAHHLIEKYPAKKEMILEAIDVPNGIGSYEKECNFYPYNDNMKIIHALKAQLLSKEVKGFSHENMAYYDKAEMLLCSHFSATKDEDFALETILDNITLKKVLAEVKHPFSDFKVAFYAGDFECKDLPEVQAEAKRLLTAIGAEVIDFAFSVRGDGFDIVIDDASVAYKKAGNIIFDAIDCGAEIIVVDSKESHFMMDQCKKECEKAVGRDIRVPILNISQMVALAVGIMDKEKIGLDAHKIAVEFV